MTIQTMLVQTPVLGWNWGDVVVVDDEVPLYAALRASGRLTDYTAPAGQVLTANPNEVVRLGDLRARHSPARDALREEFLALVTPEQFGAVGDGVADDTAALQAAFDAVDPVLGGTVFLPAGRYRITTGLVVRSNNTQVVGEGPGPRNGVSQGGYGTRLEAGGTLNGAPLLRIQLDSNDKPANAVTLRDFAVDGMGVATGAGIHFRSNRGYVEQVFVWNFGGHGFHLQGYPSWDVYDSVLFACQAAYNGGSGLHLDDGATDMHFTNCILYNNLDNMQLAGGGSPQVHGCHFYAAGRYDIYFNGAGSRGKFIGCKIEGAQQHGVLFDSTNGGYSDIQFVACGFASHGRAGANTYDWVSFTGPTANGIARTLFAGCSFSTKAGTPLPRSFLNLATSAAQGTVVSGCAFGPAAQYGTAAVLGTGTALSATTFTGNGGYTPAAGVGVRTSAVDTTLTATDQYLRANPGAGATVTVTVPANATTAIPVGTEVLVYRLGAGTVALAGDTGVTFSGAVGAVLQQYDAYRLRKVFADQWDISVAQLPPAVLAAGPGVLLATSGNTTTVSLREGVVRTVTADYTPVVGDGYIRMNSAAATTVTIPPNASVSLPVGTQLRVRRHGAGTVALAAGTGVTLTGPTTGVIQFGSYMLIKVFTDQWDVELS